MVTAGETKSEKSEPIVALIGDTPSAKQRIWMHKLQSFLREI